MSDDNMSDPFESLKQVRGPDPRADAKSRALAEGLAAFAAAQEKPQAASQGNAWGHRLTSIIRSFKGKTIMDMRLPIGTAAIALLVLPLGYQLYSTTSMTPGDVVVPRPTIVEPPPPEAVEERADSPAAGTKAAEPMAQDNVMLDTEVAREIAPVVGSNTSAAPRQVQSMAPAGASTMPSPAPMPSIMLQPAEPAGDSFTRFDEQRLKLVADEPVSTFAVDVDTASYAYMRRLLEDGVLPQPDAVRIEELVNYFPYDYAPAESATVPFQPTLGVFPTPWNPRTRLLQIGIKGYVPAAGEDKPSNLVFLIDTSGSMDAPDKLPLLKRAFALLVNQLGANDTISIVAYAGSAGVVLEPTVATEKAKILRALDQLGAGGSTAGAEGITLAYRLAEEARVAGGTNRVILATDGDFNVGIDDPQDLETFIRIKRDSGTTLSVLGFGRGNLDDATMQALAQTGNGNASYISSFREAQKVLVEEMGGTLDMIAKDVKIQVEFNPAMVSEYRLIGYETRALNREDFNNDAVDAGDIGAGHTVTALYEITPAGSDAALIDPLRYGQAAAKPDGQGEIAFLKMRYKLPDRSVSQLIEAPVTPDVVHADIEAASDDMRFAAAVAAFGQKLKGSDYGSAIRWDEIEALARSGRGADEGGYRAEFIRLVRDAALLKPDTAANPCDSTESDEACE
jgi:Ca-activated chloride channel family protein